ncbi:MAG TPA: energy-coupling factor ABC transporter ATP-binding protein [Chloroflexi bacterium]|nr:energy-coupling factor ABC transporter ATP-binding protein [Chloroflexota bacterium]
MASEVVIALHEVSYRYPTGKEPVLRGVSLELRRGEYAGLVGTTGAGKTTLCQTFNGLIPHYTRGEFQGTVEVAGVDTRRGTVAELATQVGLVFQDADAQLVMSTVEEECMLGPLSRGVSRAEARTRAHHMLATLEIPHLAQRSPQALSGGQKQRVAIAAVMVTEPAVLVLDEATSELDAMMVQKIFALCDKLNQQLGTTILIVSHEMELLAQHASRLILMDEGRIILDGPTREVLEQAEVFRRAGVRLPQVTEFAVRLELQIPWATLPLSEAEAEAGLRRRAYGAGPID